MAPVIGYHYPCPDGIYAALCAHVHFRSLGVTPRWLPLAVYATEASRLEAAAALTAEDDLYLLDFSGGVNFILAACKQARRVFLIDHHKTAADDIAALPSRPENLDTTFVDMMRSGATLSRDYFNASPFLSSEVLETIELVEDNDLWRHKLVDSKAFAAGFAALKLEMDPGKNSGIWSQLLSFSRTAIVAAGRLALEEEAAIIKSEAATAFTVSVASPPLTCLAIITMHPGLRSTAGNLLAEASLARGLDACGIIAYTEPGAGSDVIKVSARGVADFDTTLFTKAYGGGGHKGASSCIVSEAVFASWREAGSKKL